MTYKQIRVLKEKFGLFLLRASIGIAILFLIWFLTVLFMKGGKMLSWTFLTQSPINGMTEGGIAPAIVGTLYLVLIALSVAIPFGILSAFFLVEYAKPKWLVSIIRTSINTLAGVPSIVFGLFGMAIFVYLFDFDVSLLSAGLTLGILILPVIINSTEEALKTVPQSFREASFALGASKMQTVLKVVLPTALPNILTGIIISIGRAAGETAPILFTGATLYTRGYPTSLFDETMALPYQIYALMAEGTNPAKQTPIVYGSALVLLLLVVSVSLIGIILRTRIRKERKW